MSKSLQGFGKLILLPTLIPSACFAVVSPAPSYGAVTRAAQGDVRRQQTQRPLPHRSNEAFGNFHQMLGRDSEFFHYLAARRAHSEALDSNDFPV